MSRRESEWRTTRLGDHVDIQTGFPFKSKEYVDDPSGVRLLRGDNIVQGQLRWEGVKRWPQVDASNFGKYSLQANDVVLAMDRPWIEAGLKFAWITEHDLPCLLVQRVCRLRGQNGLLTPYIRYVIGHHAFADYVKGIWTGVAVPHISESQIRAFDFRLPPVATQERILNILTAYDDLIENNIRRIKILEEMAQILYREWFVNFRFPGHKKVRTVKSDLGLIPDGWKVGIVNDLLLMHREGINPSQFPDEHFSHFSIPAFDERRLPADELGQTIHSNKYLVVPGSILLSKLNPRIPRLWWTSETDLREVASTEFLVLTPRRDGDRIFIYHFLSSPSFQGNFVGLALGTSTSHQRVKPDDFLRLPCVLPDPGTRARFCKMAEPMMEQIEVLRRTNANLRTTRDFLLPKLISGQISVEVADELVAQTA